MISTIDLIKQRKAANSQFGDRDDPYKVALVIEGGGMRGVVSGGMVMGLQQLEMAQCFDAVYGTSAGAFAGAYFLADRADIGTSIFYEDINNEKFISLKRLFDPSGVVSVDFLTKHVMTYVKPLTLEQFKKTDIPLYSSTTCLETGNTLYFSEYLSDDDLHDKLRASSRMPILSGKPETVDGKHYVDGGLGAQIPFRKPAEEGFTHILCLVPRAKVWKVPAWSWAELFAALVLRKYSAGAFQAQYKRRSIIHRDVKFLVDNHGAAVDGTFYDTIFIGDECTRIGRTERDANVLMQGMKDGITAVYNAFGEDMANVFTTVQNLRD